MRSILWVSVVGLFTYSAAFAETVTLTPSRDTTIYERDGISNGMGTFLFAGRTGEVQKAFRRALIAFDVGSSVPAGSTINSASVTLNLSKTSNDDPVDFNFHRVLTSWGEGNSNAGGNEGKGGSATAGDATWTLAVTPDKPWTKPGGDFNSTPSLTSTVMGLGKYTWTSTPAAVADVQAWLDNGAANFGWILIGEEQIERSARRFDSREITNAETRPMLTIDFTRGPVGLVGDFDGNGTLDAADIDALTSEVLAGTHQTRFDLNNDQLVNDADRQTWIVDVRKTYLGDSNLDGTFSSADFVTVFVAGQYEDGVERNSTWATGDWNGDREFDSSDFVSAFIGGGYEVGPRAAESVPEPAGVAIMLAGVLGVLRSRSVRKRKNTFIDAVFNQV